jgi:hypothetical protein
MWGRSEFIAMIEWPTDSRKWLRSITGKPLLEQDVE